MTSQTKTSKNKSGEPKAKTTVSSKSEEKKNPNAETKLTTIAGGPDPRVTAGWPRPDKHIYALYCDKKIHDYDAKEFQGLARGLKVLQKFLGLKGDNILTGEAEDKMLEFVQDYFGDLSTAEIQHAFDMASAKVLEGLNYDKYEHHHFMQFGAPYLGTILRCYQVKRSQIILKYQRAEQELNRQVIKEQQPARTAEQDFNDKKILSINVWENYLKMDKNTRALSISGMHIVYDFLTEQKIINHTDEILAKAKEGAIVNVRNTDLKNKNMSTDRIKALLTQLQPDVEMKRRVEIETKRVALIKFFNDLMDTGTDLTDLFPAAAALPPTTPEIPENTQKTE